MKEIKLTKEIKVPPDAASFEDIKNYQKEALLKIEQFYNKDRPEAILRFASVSIFSTDHHKIMNDLAALGEEGFNAMEESELDKYMEASRKYNEVRKKYDKDVGDFFEEFEKIISLEINLAIIELLGERRRLLKVGEEE